MPPRRFDLLAHLDNLACLRFSLTVQYLAHIDGGQNDSPCGTRRRWIRVDRAHRPEQHRHGTEDEHRFPVIRALVLGYARATCDEQFTRLDAYRARSGGRRAQSGSRS